MDRLRFRRSSKKDKDKDAAAPAPGPGPGPGPGRESGSTTPEPKLAPPAPQVPAKKPSPFRGLHFHRSGKRGRSPPPASLPLPPLTAVHSQDGAADRPPSSPLAARKEGAAVAAADTAADDDAPPEASRPPTIPGFLTLSTEDIDRKFQDIIWLERNRLMQSVTNPSPDFQWARVSGPHLKALDRYTNIQPWYNNRVKLRVPPGHVDYINASPIHLASPAAEGAGAAAPAPRPADRYIAMQGPKQSSVDHVWRMVVEQLESPGVIVMLTETHEANVEKCAPYFPRAPGGPPLEVNEHDEFGDGFRASVRCEALEDTPAGDAIELRKLVIRVHQRGKRQAAAAAAGDGDAGDGDANGPGVPIEDENGDVTMLSPRIPAARKPHHNGAAGAAAAGDRESAAADGNDEEADKEENEDDDDDDDDEGEEEEEEEEEERVVWHFLYKKWPDFGVPRIEDLGSFFTLMRLSREKNAGPDNPRIVHCSAGVGRSGTFIALDHLIRELDAGTLEHYDADAADAAGPGGEAGEPAARDGDGDGDGKNGDGKDGDGPGGQEEEEGDGDGDGDGDASAAEPEKEDLIFYTVNQLRKQRRNMVQAEAQFLFIYQVMRKLWLDRYGAGDEAEPAAKRLEYDPFVEG